MPEEVTRCHEAGMDDLLAKPVAMRPKSALEVKKVLESLADPLSAALKTPAPSQVAYNAYDQLSDSLQRPVRGEESSAYPRHYAHQEWEHTESTPIVDAPLKSVSIMWYLLPVSLFMLLLYLILNTFK